VHADLDSPPRISGFRKLKLTNCAPISGPSSVYIVRKSGKSRSDFRRRDCAGFNQHRGQSSRWGSRSKRAAPGLRALHGSGGITAALHCFRIVFFNSPRFGAMHFCLVAREIGGCPALPHSSPSRKASPAGRNPRRRFSVSALYFQETKREKAWGELSRIGTDGDAHRAELGLA
jgi:hypothetical protein